MENLERVVAAYLAMDKIRRGQCLQFLELQATAHPERAVPLVPALKLIVGGKAGH